MERRFNYRPTVAFQVRVTVATDPRLSASGETIDISKSGIAVSVPLQFAPGSLVHLEIADSTLSGFVVYSREWPQVSESSFARNKSWSGGLEANGSADLPPGRTVYRTGIEVVEVSIGTSGLSELLKGHFQDTGSTLIDTPSSARA